MLTKIHAKLHTTAVSQKTAPFYVCNKFVSPSSILIIFGNVYSNKFGTKRYQNRQSLLNVFIMPCETQHAYTCHNRRQLRHVSLNIIIIVS